MTMHLVGPALTSLNTRKRKNTKWKSAEHKRQAERNAALQAEIRAEFAPSTVKRNKIKSVRMVNNSIPSDRSSRRYASHSESGMEIGNTARRETQQYNGERQLLGIAVMHKSVLVPVFSQTEAVEISRMRRG